MKEKARRWDILNTLLYESVRKRNELMIGRIEEVLVSEKGKDGQFIGRTRNFKEIYISPVGADLCVCPDTLECVCPDGECVCPDPIEVGDLITVKITEMDRWVLKGEKI